MLGAKVHAEKSAERFSDIISNADLYTYTAWDLREFSRAEMHEALCNSKIFKVPTKCIRGKTRLFSILLNCVDEKRISFFAIKRFQY